MSKLSEVSKERIRLMYQIGGRAQTIKKRYCVGARQAAPYVYLVRWVFLYIDAFRLASVGVICQ